MGNLVGRNGKNITETTHWSFNLGTSRDRIRAGGGAKARDFDSASRPVILILRRLDMQQSWTHRQTAGLRKNRYLHIQVVVYDYVVGEGFHSTTYKGNLFRYTLIQFHKYAPISNSIYRQMFLCLTFHKCVIVFIYKQNLLQREKLLSLHTLYSTLV